MKTDFLKRNSPPGMSMKQELGFFLTGMIASLLDSFRFLLRYSFESQNLYEVIDRKRVLIKGAIMPDFITLLDRSLIGFGLVALCMIGFIIYHYAYYRQGSKSIYLMKRLPKRSELHRRALTVPLLAMLTSALTAFILLLLYFAIYMLATPAECLTPDQWQKIWRIF